MLLRDLTGGKNFELRKIRRPIRSEDILEQAAREQMARANCAKTAKRLVKA